MSADPNPFDWNGQPDIAWNNDEAALLLRSGEANFDNFQIYFRDLTHSIQYQKLRVTLVRDRIKKHVAKVTLNSADQEHKQQRKRRRIKHFAHLLWQYLYEVPPPDCRLMWP